MSTMKSHAWQILVVALAGWLNRQQQDVVEYLQEENRVCLPKSSSETDLKKN
jgi:hypothetical protein